MSSPLLKPEEKNKLKKQSNRLLPVLVCALAIPLSMSMWLFNVGYSYFIEKVLYDDYLIIHPSRWLVASLSCFTVIIYGLKRRSLTPSGAFLGFFVGMILTIGSYCFLACLMVFFLTSSKATKFREPQKARLEKDHKEGGQRSWVHVLCNGGMATQLSFLYLLDAGCGERPINFAWDYRPSWLAMGVLGSFACCNGDTWASELGTVLGTGDPWLITNWKRVPRGTNGGVSIQGIILSAIGGLMVGSAHYLTVVYMADRAVLANSPDQWPILVVGLLAGLVGSLVDSFLGATLQYSGIDMNGRIVSSPGKGVKHISGCKVLDNHGVNLISSVIMGFAMPYVAMAIWPY